jgi:hypothetical protein
MGFARCFAERLCLSLTFGYFLLSTTPAANTSPSSSALNMSHNFGWTRRSRVWGLFLTPEGFKIPCFCTSRTQPKMWVEIGASQEGNR